MTKFSLQPSFEDIWHFPLSEVRIQLFHERMTKMGLTRLLTMITSRRGECDQGEGDDVYILYTIAVYELKFYEHKTYNLNFLKFNCI